MREKCIYGFTGYTGFIMISITYKYYIYGCVYGFFKSLRVFFVCVGVEGVYEL